MDRRIARRASAGLWISSVTTVAGRLWPGIVAPLRLSACLEPRASFCSDGRICPPGTLCDGQRHRCVEPGQEAACSGQGEGGACSFRGTPGACRAGLCESIRCGDGVISPPEDCEGDDLGGADCPTMGFYDAPGLRCSSVCSFDVSSCTGLCGDGVTNGSEACDGDLPAGQTCLDYGFDRGLLACSEHCQPATGVCQAFGWKGVMLP